jgi:hypothetical protein
MPRQSNGSAAAYPPRRLLVPGRPGNPSDRGPNSSRLVDHDAILHKVSLLMVRVVGVLLLGLLGGGPAAVATCSVLCASGLTADGGSRQHRQHHASPSASTPATAHAAHGEAHAHQGQPAPAAAASVASDLATGVTPVANAAREACVVRPMEAALASARAEAAPPVVAVLPSSVLFASNSSPLQYRGHGSPGADLNSGPPPPLVLRI